MKIMIRRHLAYYLLVDFMWNSRSKTECLLCYRVKRLPHSLVCTGCLKILRKEMRITAQDLKEAKERGFFRDSSVFAKLDSALGKLDQIEPKLWLSRSIEAKKTV